MQKGERKEAGDNPAAAPPGYTWQDHLFRAISIAFALLYVINYFLAWRALYIAGALLLLVILYEGMRRLPKVNLRVVGGLFLAGGAALAWSGADLRDWLAALMQNASLAAMFTAAPLLALPFYYEDYQSELARAARAKMQRLPSFMLLMAVSGYILNLLVGVGAIVIAYEMFYPHSKLYRAEELFYPALTRTNCSSGFWSPAWAAIALTTAYTGTPWVDIIPAGIAFSLIYILIDMLFIALHIRRRPGRYPRLQPMAGERVNPEKIAAMVLMAAVMLGMIALISAGAGWSLMVAIPIVAVAFPLLAALAQGHLPAYKTGMAKYYRDAVLKSRSEAALFTAAGFLGKALEVSGIGGKIPALLPDWLRAYPALMIMAIMLIIILPSLAGVHAVATGTALLTALTPQGVGMSQMAFVMTVLTGWMLSIPLSPFSAISMIAGGYAGRPSWEISLKKNGLFGLVCLVVFSLLIYLAGSLLQA
jgi:hypothetical protein